MAYQIISYFLILFLYTLSYSLKLSMTNFIKYQGLGNDFILVDNTHSDIVSISSDKAAKLCDRNFGIGADGIIFAMPPSNGCDYSMRMYNADGSEPQMCGNGIRCMAKFLKEIEGKKDSKEVKYTIHTLSGKIIPEISIDGMVTVDMGYPTLKAEDVPTKLAVTKDDGSAIESDININGKIYKSTAVSMGNPHSIIFVDSFDKMDPPFSVVGPLVESHEMFPEAVNAEFVEVLNSKHLNMKVWERGAGPTLACGTGACAVCVAGVLTGRSERECTITLPGGDLYIKWKESDGKLYMTGPADEVFRGTFNLQ